MLDYRQDFMIFDVPAGAGISIYRASRSFFVSLSTRNQFTAGTAPSQLIL